MSRKRSEVDKAGKYVRYRQEQQYSSILVHDRLGQHLLSYLNLLHEVRVRELDAFRASSGAGGVDNCGYVLGL